LQYQILISKNIKLKDIGADVSPFLNTQSPEELLSKICI
jgi:hypothetical protein